MALKENRIWSLVIFITIAIVPIHGKITKMKRIVHEHSKIENAPLNLTNILKERQLLGRFSGSKLIKNLKHKEVSKNVKNMKNAFKLPPGRNLTAVYTNKIVTHKKKAKVNLKNLNVERQLRKKGKMN